MTRTVVMGINDDYLSDISDRCAVFCVATGARISETRLSLWLYRERRTVPQSENF
ncbi:MAG: hypothetical protein LBS40_05330 [Burkholderiales bacterium]|nr:hypothetical protein [Burkholderiales bacterium]